jgi:hypothetical protein
MADHEDDLAVAKTEGFKVGEKKTLQEYQELGWCPSHLRAQLLYTCPYTDYALPS